jgi:hypothetical protein
MKDPPAAQLVLDHLAFLSIVYELDEDDDRKMKLAKQARNYMAMGRHPMTGPLGDVRVRSIMSAALAEAVRLLPPGGTPAVGLK